jgi:hypothetical protein
MGNATRMRKPPTKKRDRYRSFVSTKYQQNRKFLPRCFYCMMTYTEREYPPDWKTSRGKEGVKRKGKGK